MNDETILVTGGTGSFGNRFVQTVLDRFEPRKLIVFSRDEHKQHQMRQVHPDGPGSRVRYFLGDVRDIGRLQRAFAGVDVVVHAAALKHVPACEYNPFEAIQTNILGAKNVIDAAIDQGVKKVLAVSTDKAVNPVNLYGATKLCAEKLFIQGNAYSTPGGPLFSCTRYGNVVASRGSVIPAFLEQRQNGTVNITDRRMTRFLITLTQGVDFVIKCLAEMSGGEIFVPKIPSMKLTDLVEALAPDCTINEVGIRQGEKLNEVLLSEEEARHAIDAGDMYVIFSHDGFRASTPPPDVETLVDPFHYASDTNPHQLSVGELRAMGESAELND